MISNIDSMIKWASGFVDGEGYIQYKQEPYKRIRIDKRIIDIEINTQVNFFSKRWSKASLFLISYFTKFSLFLILLYLNQ